MTHAIPILMYHSISEGPGPTCLPPETFRGQLQVLADEGYEAVALRDLAPWHRGETALPPRAVAITFDDGFCDFMTDALPDLLARNWPATVFLPSGKVGGCDDWETGGGLGQRPLMSWQDVRQIAGGCVSFGAHGITHRDLASLSHADAVTEIRDSKRMIEQRADFAVDCFAPPYGSCTPRLVEEIRRQYAVSVGTVLDCATTTSDLADLPRIEMHYFRDLRRWRRFLRNRGGLYFSARKTLRRLRGQLTLLRPTSPSTAS